MGWISAAVCALIACIFLYRLLNRDRFQKAKPTQVRNPEASDSAKSSGSSLRNEQTNLDPPSFAIVEAEPIAITPAAVQPVQVQEESRSMSDSTDSPNMLPPPPPPPRSQADLASTMMPPPPPSRTKSPPRLKPPSFGPAPPRPGGGSLQPPPSAASSLRVPQQKVLQNTSMQPSSLMPPPNKPSRQVVLEPGHSPLDWAALTSKPNNNLRGKGLPDHLIRVTPSQLKAQNGRKGKDAWTVYQGKVYNITPYVPFHPGGKGEILRGAAKDSVKLFMEVHPWVNWDGMLGECLVGILVAEEDENEANQLDEMD